MGIRMVLSFIYGALVSVGIGALIGLEREHRRGDDATLVGIRTFPLVALSGYILSFLGKSDEALSIMIVAGFLLFGALAIILIYIRQSMGFPGFTTTLAFIITYLVGVLVAYDFVIEAVIVGVATTTILISKERVHAFVRVLSEEEIIGALQFITIAFILYPLTLDLHLEGPWQIFGKGEPLDLNMALLIVLFVSTISFISFLVVRWQGPSRGLRFSGLLGGLVNSEAATASLCGVAKKKPNVLEIAAYGIVLANATMFIRNLAVCIFADPTLEVAGLTIVPLLLLCAFGIMLGWRNGRDETTIEMEVGSPFAIRPAVTFGAIFFIISGTALILQEQLGGAFIYFLALGGFASSAAVVASVSSLALAGTIDPQVAAEIVMLACAISSANKIIISRLMCPKLSRKVLTRLVISTALAFIGAGVVFSFRILP
jgi:uncharacterized membrane protein (DUF4010 family)